MNGDPVAAVPPPGLPQGNWQGLVGRTIEAVVTAGHDGATPRMQVYLVLDGEEHFEIFTAGILQGNREMQPGGLADLQSRRAFGSKHLVYGPVEVREGRVEE